jgi:hypothetical protein
MSFREPHFVEYTFFTCRPSGEMRSLPLVACRKSMQCQNYMETNTDLNAEFAELSDMKFQMVLWLLFY